MNGTAIAVCVRISIVRLLSSFRYCLGGEKLVKICIPENSLISGAVDCSDYPNQLNNVLVFSGIFKGLLQEEFIL